MVRSLKTPQVIYFKSLLSFFFQFLTGTLDTNRLLCINCRCPFALHTKALCESHFKVKDG